MKKFSEKIRSDDNPVIKLKQKKDSVSNKSSKISLKSKKLFSPLVVSRDYDNKEKYFKWIQTIPGFIEGLTSLHGEPTILYPYQVSFMNESSPFRWVNKSRQTGFSFVIAAESLAKSHLKNVYQSIFISINREEANNKIEYARALYESLPLGLKKKIVVDNRFSLVFESHDGKYRTKLTSLAQRSPRGPGYETDVSLDEFAHFYWSKEIYVATLPIISRGNGVLNILSSPFGNKGQFYEIFANRDKYSEFSKIEIPWWLCRDFCLDVNKAIKFAENKSTQERVMKYANPKLRQIFKSMDIMDFQQEYECLFVDEATAYYPLSLIKSCVYNYEDDDWLKDVDIDMDEKEKYLIEKKYPDVNFKIYKTLEGLLEAVQKQEIGRNLMGGYDIGRKKDSSEFTIIEEINIKDGGVLKVVRYTEELANTTFKKQEGYLDRILSSGILLRLMIDATGLGMHLAENLESKHRSIVDSVVFTGFEKSIMAKKVKICFEDQILAIPDKVDIIKQIHSIRRTITDTSNEKYASDDGDRKKHHADKFWSLALAVHAGTEPINFKEDTDVLFKVDEHRIFSPMAATGKVSLMPPGEFSCPLVLNIGDNAVSLGSGMPIPDDLAGLSRKKIY